jgi:protein SCO1/2
MGGFFGKPLNWLFIFAGSLLAATTAFVVFKPVRVVPRIAYGPAYQLIDQNGEPFTDAMLRGQVVLYGFGYISDPTGGLDQTVDDMRRFWQMVEAEGLRDQVTMVLILFDDQRDTPEQRAAFAREHHLDPESWILLGGDAPTLKRVIGQGFGVYYERVPLSDLLGDSAVPAEAYGYLQAQRTILVDERNLIRAEYRSPLDLELAMRDVRLIIREKNSTGAARALNEAAHLFMCYPK